VITIKFKYVSSLTNILNYPSCITSIMTLHYDYKLRNVIDVQKELCDLYMSSEGQRQRVTTVFKFLEPLSVLTYVQKMWCY
jgi:hypothetical protein